MKSKNICVIGMGYVGLTLSVVLAEKRFVVYGIENNPEINKTLNQGKAHFFENRLDHLLKKYLNKNLFIYESIPADKEIDVFIISVGTPVDKETKKPVTDYIIKAAESVSRNLKDEQLIILRSTVPIGTTREVVGPILEKSGKKFYLAFCPERTAEGAALKELNELPQIIGGINEESVEKAMEVFRKITPTLVAVSSLEVAEINKMLDNYYRDLNFACANEIAIIMKKLGLDGYEAIKAVNLGYFRNGIPIPGFVGGACLEKDPWIFMDSVFQRTGYMPKLVKIARELNLNLPLIVAESVNKNLKNRNIDKGTAKVFISGFAFKGTPSTDDLRGSSTLDLLTVLKDDGFKNIYGHDFVVVPEKIAQTGIRAVDLEEGFKDADVVLFMNNHPSYVYLDIYKLLLTTKKEGLFFDGWHFYDPEAIAALGHVHYEGLSVATHFD